MTGESRWLFGLAEQHRVFVLVPQAMLWYLPHHQNPCVSHQRPNLRLLKPALFPLICSEAIRLCPQPCAKHWGQVGCGELHGLCLPPEIKREIPK